MKLHDPLAILFDIDGTLLITGGAGAASWRLASRPTSDSSPTRA
jgi:phosphoglycolate phosphatase-like HAD superfamily hydrolase